MNHILVPIDFSDTSMNALEYAVNIAKEIGAEITLFNSYPIDVPMGVEFSSGVYMQTLNAELKLDRELRMEELKNDYKNLHYRFTNQPLKINFKITEGVATECISDLANSGNFSMVVMGTKGASGFDEILFGSITMAVVEKVHIPVLAIPKEAKFQGLKRIVYATNFDDADIKVIDQIRDLGEHFDSEITCLHINTEPEFAFTEDVKLNTLKKNYTFTPLNKLNFKMIFQKRVAKGLNDYLNENQVDMLAILPQDRSFVEDLFHSSLTRRMTYHSKIPVLVART